MTPPSPHKRILFILFALVVLSSSACAGGTEPGVVVSVNGIWISDPIGPGEGVITLRLVEASGTVTGDGDFVVGSLTAVLSVTGERQHPRVELLMTSLQATEDLRYNGELLTDSLLAGIANGIGIRGDSVFFRRGA